MLGLSAHTPVFFFFCNSNRSGFEVAVSHNVHRIRFSGLSYNETNSARNWTASTQLSEVLLRLSLMLKIFKQLNTRKQISCLATK